MRIARRGMKDIPANRKKNRAETLFTAANKSSLHQAGWKNFCKFIWE
jgi:hypothetical protein